MPKPKLIALYSSAPQSGKSTVAGYLDSRGYQCLKFAQPIKDMICMLLMHDGYKIEQARKMVEEGKNTPIPFAFAGKTPRELQQTLGTEWGRNTVNKELWVGLMVNKILSSKVPVVVDDMRFPDEYDCLKGLGALMVRVDRPGATKPNGHSSEGALDAHDFDVVLENMGTLSDLRDSVYKMVG
jgi:hypothetical protein